MISEKLLVATAIGSYSATAGANAAVSYGQNGEISFIPQSADTAVAQLQKLTNISKGQMRRFTVKKSNTEQPQIYTLTFTEGGANLAEYAFQIVQVINGQTNVATFDFTAPASGTVDATITTPALALVNTNKAKGIIGVVATAASNVITLTAQAGTPLFSVVNVTNFTLAAAMPIVAPHGTPGTAIAGNAVVTVTTLAAQTFRTGDTVTVASAATFLMTQNGISGLTTVTARITYVSATTFTLDGVTGNGLTNTGTITVTQVAQVSYGSAAQVAQNILDINGQVYAADSTSWYNSITIESWLDNEIPAIYTLWYKASLVASPYTPTTNVAGFEQDYQIFADGIAVPAIIVRGGTAATDIAGTTTVTVTTAVSQSFRTGDTVRIIGMVGYSITQNGVAGLLQVTAQITAATSTTFTLNGCVGTGTNTGAISIVDLGGISAQQTLGEPKY